MLDGGQIVLDAAAAQGVLDPVLLFLAREVRLADEVLAVGGAQPISTAFQRDVGGEISENAARRRRLQHLAVPAAGPVGVDLPMTGGARLGADKRGFRLVIRL